MSINRKIQLLLAACILLVTVLCFIQYRLIHNTYKLTKEKYTLDVKNAIAAVAKPYIDSINAHGMAMLQKELQSYHEGKINKTAFLHAIQQNNSLVNALDNEQLMMKIRQNPLLENVRYQFQYNEIVLEWAGKTDTLLATSDKPFVLAGNQISNTDSLLLNPGAQWARFGAPLLMLKVKHAESIDMMAWEKEVWSRMLLILCEAVGLIVAVIVLLYLVFKALIRQKKVAEIQTDFANNITHELKTPLASLSIIAKSLQKKELRNDTEVLDKLILSLDKQQTKLQHIVNSVLETSLATKPIAFSSININSFLKQFVAEQETNHHTLTLEIPSEQVWITTNTNKLQTILNNLLDNAFKYSPKNTEVKIKANLYGSTYQIAISDEGMGISQKEQRSIFDKFYRVSKNSEESKGLGLGLYLCKKAISELNGTISVTSAPPRGSMFTITLPL